MDRLPRGAEDWRHLPPGAARGRYEQDRRQDSTIVSPPTTATLRPNRRLGGDQLEQAPQVIRYESVDHAHALRNE
ncbi:hypothetical protein XF35_21310 [Streptomyces platensis subsp. clarensis]|nr:hypothetical protein [Streptomyces platensis subsp. clarensis]